ncbi:MAG: TonB-dependent receptor plug domain-containing protein, partial [Flammeovirgaceae bacterium]
MTKYLFVLYSSIFFGDRLCAQTDSTKLLDQVIIKAFAYKKPLQQVPASVAVIESKDLTRFSNTSFLPALNTIPGLRMEERSPGSFRLAIRGSSL